MKISSYLKLPSLRSPSTTAVSEKAPRRLNYLLPLILLFGLSYLSACSMATRQPEVEGPPARQQLQRQAARASVWRFVYCLKDDTNEKDLVNLLQEIADSQPFGKRIEVFNCDDLSRDTLGTGPLALFGNRLPETTPTFPLKQLANNWQLTDAHDFTGDDILLLPLYQNPWADGNTVTSFYLSENIGGLISRLRKEFNDEWGRMFRRNWAYALHRGNGDRVYGAYKDTTWAFDQTEEITLHSPEEPVYDEHGLKIFSYDGVIAPTKVKALAEALHLINHAVDTLSKQAPGWHPEVRLYPTLERIGLHTGNMVPVQYDSKSKLLHLVPSFLKEDEILSFFDAWRAYTAHYHPQLKHPQSDLLIGTMMYLNKDRLNSSFFYATDFSEESTSCLFKEGRKYFEQGWQAVLDYDNQYNKLLPDLLAGRVKARALQATQVANAEQRPPLMPEHLLAGMTFAHEGYRIHNGYGGEKIKPSMARLAELNVNALAVVPYTFMRNPDKAHPLFIPRDAGSENDWATARSIREAHTKGWFTMLKPQIWLGGGHWPGDVDFQTEAAWEKWFDSYRYWIKHYAVLAEKEKVGALCLGTELVKTTLKHPDKWRSIIAEVRQVYSGQLTYAANWGEEFEGFTFWEDLDAIGLNSYYPIHEGEEVNQAALNAGAMKWMKMAAEVSRKTGKPLWLTEVGFRSVDQPWKNPHAEAGERKANPLHQAACYQALAEAAKATPELKGMFIWKWPSYLGDNRRSRGFTPSGKAAARTLGDFYGEWVKQSR